MDHQTAAEYDLKTPHPDLVTGLIPRILQTDRLLFLRFNTRTYYLDRDDTPMALLIPLLKVSIHHSVHLTETDDGDLTGNSLTLITIPQMLEICTCCHCFYCCYGTKVDI